MKKRFLIFCDSYLPGYRGGGGMWMVVNLVDRFRDKYDFFVITRNHDCKNDSAVYTDVTTNEWNEVSGANVFYISPGSLTTRKVADLSADVRPDAFFLNSVFSMPTRQLLSARRNGLIGGKPVILASCGEMSQHALAIKSGKKKLFLRYAKFRSLYDGVIWKASFDSEADEIRKVMGRDAEVMVAPDLAPRSILPDYRQELKPAKVPGSVRFVFVSRVVPIKNIDFFLERLTAIVEGDVTFDIVGPLENTEYWARCREVISRLPQNLKINAIGALPNADALKRLCEAHFFVLPTLSENFGYVIIEALAAGCPLLISNRTVWNDLEERNVGWSIPLEQPDRYVEQIKRCISMDNEEYEKMSRSARQYALDWLAKPENDDATARVLKRALEGP